MLQMLFRLYPIICLARNSGGADCPCPVLLCFFINHEHYERGYTPKAKKKKACYVCSLKDLCLPELEKTGNVETYMNNILAEDLEDNT